MAEAGARQGQCMLCSAGSGEAPAAVEPGTRAQPAVCWGAPPAAPDPQDHRRAPPPQPHRPAPPCNKPAWPRPSPPPAPHSPRTPPHASTSSPHPCQSAQTNPQPPARARQTAHAQHASPLPTRARHPTHAQHPPPLLARAHKLLCLGFSPSSHHPTHPQQPLERCVEGGSAQPPRDAAHDVGLVAGNSGLREPRRATCGGWQQHVESTRIVCWRCSAGWDARMA